VLSLTTLPRPVSRELLFLSSRYQGNPRWQKRRPQRAVSPEGYIGFSAHGQGLFFDWMPYRKISSLRTPCQLQSPSTDLWCLFALEETPDSETRFLLTREGSHQRRDREGRLPTDETPLPCTGIGKILGLRYLLDIPFSYIDAEIVFLLEVCVALSKIVYARPNTFLLQLRESLLKAGSGSLRPFPV